jgi:hypothetical protein
MLARLPLIGKKPIGKHASIGEGKWQRHTKVTLIALSAKKSVNSREP